MFSKGLTGFVLAFVIFALGFWLIYDLSAQNTIKAKTALKESRHQIEKLNKKIDFIKSYFKVELEKIDEANNRETAVKSAAGGQGGSLGLASKVDDLEKRVQKLTKESRQLRSLIQEYEDM